MLCVKCGMTIPDESRFCPECGMTQTPATGDQTALYRTSTPQYPSGGNKEIDLDKTTADFSRIPPGTQGGWQPDPSNNPPPAYAPPQMQQEPSYNPSLNPPPAGAQPQMQQEPSYNPSLNPSLTGVQPQTQPDSSYNPSLNPPPAVAPPQAQPQPAKKKLSGAVLAIIIAAAVLVVGGGGAGIYFLTRPNDAEEPEIEETVSPEETDDDSDTVTATVPVSETVDVPDVTYSYLNRSPEAVIDITAVDSIFPSNYRSLEALATFTGYSDYGDMDVVIEVEVPGFTQLYRQKVTLSRKVEKLRIVPPLITGSIDLNSEKTAQLVYSVTESDSGKLLIQESKNIKLFSKYDIIWTDGDNSYAYMDNFLAWLTPDASEIVELKRDAIDYLSYITNGGLAMLVGYQDSGLFDDVTSNTWAQIIAIQGAVSDIAQVRYNMSPFTMDAQQRVLLPADVLRTRSGICVETSLLMASALQSAGMNCMLVFPPGHAQVAVEAWPGTGEYFLIETTTLPMDMSYDGWNSAVYYLTQDEWWGYLSGEGSITMGECYVLDCSLGAKLGIRAMSN